MPIDLHLHSTASDGQLSPAEVIAAARGAGLDAVALSDHDSIEGVAEALAAGDRLGVEVIPAVELSASADSRDAHILGYFIDPADRTLGARLLELRHARLERAERMVSALHDAGFDIDLSHVQAYSREGSVGRAHVARALVERGLAEDVADAFRRFIGRDRPYYVAKTVVTPAEVIALIRAAGGVAVLAHPGVSKLDDLIEQFAATGLVGLEVYHAEHSPEQREHYRRLAAQYGLVATGGSDFHGPYSKNSKLGADVPEECLAELKRAARRWTGPDG